MHRRRRGQPHGLADLTDRRWVALLPEAVTDELEDLESLSRQRLGHVALLAPIRRRCGFRPPPSRRSRSGWARWRSAPGRANTSSYTVPPVGPRIKHLFVRGGARWGGAT